MSTEDRKDTREPLSNNAVDGVFYIKANHQLYSFDTVHNVSISGAGIELQVPLASETPVTITYDSTDCRIDVHGTIVWCEPLSTALTANSGLRYKMGVNFDPYDLQNSSMLFLALREYIDPFGDQAVG